MTHFANVLVKFWYYICKLHIHLNQLFLLVCNIRCTLTCFDNMLVKVKQNPFAIV